MTFADKSTLNEIYVLEEYIGRNLSDVDKIEMSLQKYLRTEFQPSDSLLKEIEAIQKSKANAPNGIC